MAFRCIKPGILDTVQDLGRPAHRHLGVGPGGAMDRRAVRILNILLGNDETEAVIESHFPAAEFDIEQNATIAVGGGHFRPCMNGEPLPLWKTVRVSPGDKLSFGSRAHGARAYIAVEGGFEGRKWLGSKSTSLYVKQGGLDGRKIEKGDVIGIAAPERADVSGLTAGRSLTDPYLREPLLRFVEGPEFHMLTALSANDFGKEGFTVSADSNRMGIRLTGPKLGAVADIDLVSSAVAPGVVQLLPDGNPVILGADCQTTGGYPRIARVIDADLPIAAQAGPGDKVFFRRVSLEEAYSARCDVERNLSFLRLGLRFRSFGIAREQ